MRAVAVSVSIVLGACSGAASKEPAPAEARAPSGKPSPPRAVESEPQPSEPQPSEPRSNLESIVEGLAIAWYDPDLSDDFLQLMCNSSTTWMRHRPDTANECLTDEAALYVVDSHGTERWTVHERERHEDYMLVHKGARYPATKTPLLATKDPPPVADARLFPIASSPASKRPEALAREVVELVAPHAEIHADLLSIHPVMELEGAFGGEADTLVVFESASEDFPGFQFLAALAQGKLAGVFGVDYGLMWGNYRPIATTDLDGDGASEVLWWTSAEGVGTAINLTYFADGAYRERTLYSCMCKYFFDAAYR